MKDIAKVGEDWVCSCGVCLDVPPGASRFPGHTLMVDAVNGLIIRCDQCPRVWLFKPQPSSVLTGRELVEDCESNTIEFVGAAKSAISTLCTEVESLEKDLYDIHKLIGREHNSSKDNYLCIISSIIDMKQLIFELEEENKKIKNVLKDAINNNDEGMWHSTNCTTNDTECECWVRRAREIIDIL